MSAGSQAPQGSAEPKRLRRRRRTGSSRKVLYLSIPVCALILGFIPLANYFKGTVTHTQQVQDAPLRSSDLVLAEVSIQDEGGSRYIVGTVRDQGKVGYDDVRLLFAVRDIQNAYLGAFTAEVKRVEAGQAAPFRSSAVPAQAVRMTLRDANGTPR